MEPEIKTEAADHAADKPVPDRFNKEEYGYLQTGFSSELFKVKSVEREPKGIQNKCQL